jgi:hypothetical protein
VTGLDFADPERGISAALRPSGAAVVFDHDEVLAASGDAEAHFEDAGGEASAGLELDGVSMQLQISRLGGPISLRGELGGSEELAVCRVLGEVRRDDRRHEVACLGIRSDASAGPDPDAVSLSRSIAIAFSDGGVLALRAARPTGASDHGEEEIVAALADPDGVATQIREPLLSTQYDDAGRHVRATLELWPEQAAEARPPLRAAGTIVCGTSLRLGEGRLDVAFFRWSMDGRPGLGRYEVLTAAAGD